MNRLNQRMLRWCQQYHWYGAELDYRRFVNQADDLRHTHFLLPPATEQQIALAEQLPGFLLPPTLTMLYTELANGGFGPAYGLRSLDPEDEESLINQYRGRSRLKNRPLSELGSERLWAASPQRLDLHYRLWPDRLIPICNWGCGVEMAIDCATPEGRVIRVGPAWQGLHLSFMGIAPSFEAWLQSWLNEEPVLL